jgi:hypothetical protein
VGTGCQAISAHRKHTARLSHNHIVRPNTNQCYYVGYQCAVEGATQAGAGDTPTASPLFHCFNSLVWHLHSIIIRLHHLFKCPRTCIDFWKQIFCVCSGALHGFSFLYSNNCVGTLHRDCQRWQGSFPFRAIRVGSFAAGRSRSAGRVSQWCLLMWWWYALPLREIRVGSFTAGHVSVERREGRAESSQLGKPHNRPRECFFSLHNAAYYVKQNYTVSVGVAWATQLLHVCSGVVDDVVMICPSSWWENIRVRSCTHELLH